MTRDYNQELKDRIAYIRQTLQEAHASGIVYGNSGGKDSALVGVLCRMACDQVLGVIMPCQSQRNFGEDRDDAMAVARQHGIETVTVDLTQVKQQLVTCLEGAGEISREMDVIGVSEITLAAQANIAPRLRMTALYAIAQSRNALVAGTGNRSERYMGYFTKWGDGACDFNPIADLTATEVLEFLRFLNAPENIVTKAPSAGLFEGQTDEEEMGLRYAELDRYLLTGKGARQLVEKIETAHSRSQHKLRLPSTYPGHSQGEQ